MVLDKAVYILERFRQVSEANLYKEVLTDPKPEIQNEIKETLALLFTRK